MHPYVSSTPLPCSGPLDPQGPSPSSHLFIPFSLSSSATSCLLHPYTPDTPHLPLVLALPCHPSYPHASHPPPAHLTLSTATLASHCPFTPHLLIPLVPQSTPFIYLTLPSPLALLLTSHPSLAHLLHPSHTFTPHFSPPYPHSTFLSHITFWNPLLLLTLPHLISLQMPHLSPIPNPLLTYL